MDILTWTICSFLTTIPLLYWYLMQKFNYWSNKGIKSPKPYPLVGNTLEQLLFQAQPLIELKWFKEFGKIFGIYDGTNPVLTISEPELIKSILVKDFHLFSNRRESTNNHPIFSKILIDAKVEDWKRIRSIVSPTFTSGKMKRMYPMIRQCLSEFMDCLENYAKDGKEINIKKVYGNFTMDVIASCAFATKTNTYNDPNNRFVLSAEKIFDGNPFLRIFHLIFPDFILDNLRKLLRLNAASIAARFFTDTTRQILVSRRKSDKKYSDFVQLLIEAEKDVDSSRDVNDINESHHVNEGVEELASEKKALNIILKNKHLTEDEILAQAFMFLIAGYETTASTLTFATYELALNPDKQQILYEEVMSSVDAKGELSYEELAKLPFLDAVISEAMRIHTPVLRLSRMASTDYKLGDTGITVMKGQRVEIPIYAIHMSEEYYENPTKFVPERFLPENRHLITPYTYLPFGAGPRNCIGMRFALLEAKLGLAQIVKRFKFSRSSQTDVPLNLRKTSNLLTTPKRVVVGIEIRE